jgi:hypothetical protein
MILNGDSIWMPAYTWVVRAFGITALCLMVLSDFGGCSASDVVGNLTVNPVKGKVLLADGKPLTTGRVVFVDPEREEKEFYGPIGPDGSFSIRDGDKEGVPEGKYIVRIDPEASMGLAKGKPKKRSAAFPFPAKYANEMTPGLTAAVKAGPNDLKPFKLDK